MDRLTESSHIIFVKCTNTAKDYATFYTNEIESLHGIPLSIIFDWIAQFICRFLKYLQKGLGTQLKLRTSFHPQ